jgi:hypothetical protein
MKHLDVIVSGQITFILSALLSKGDWPTGWWILSIEREKTTWWSIPQEFMYTRTRASTAVHQMPSSLRISAPSLYLYSRLPSREDERTGAAYSLAVAYIVGRLSRQMGSRRSERTPALPDLSPYLRTRDPCRQGDMPATLVKLPSSNCFMKIEDIKRRLCLWPLRLFLVSLLAYRREVEQ